MKASFLGVIGLVTDGAASRKLSAVTLTDAKIALLRQEVNEWKSAFGEEARLQGAIPPASTALESLDNNDEIQRFFYSKLAVDAARRSNPHAQLALNVFALLNPTKFASFVQRSLTNDMVAPTELDILEAENALPAQVDWTTAVALREEACVVEGKMHNELTENLQRSP
ncbi:hypothetical protein DYB30_012670 [Aphanomyces astaci]|uniref:Uncharacterized protein n=2 Tax=Aphanomyces astaci TaxID=112090 RepID=A0A397A8H3_APHAT|nr:hypothetical protein AaE_010928 [Aphanomyces astaci]RHY02624.1 hypothetical protein DYB36_010446 [Aphanomyces astaci]RHY78754.1 hypothetical protein DYB30_012670 [Aphanomyces astaci]